MSKANAQRTINVIKTAIDKTVSNGAMRSYKYGVITQGGSDFVSAYINGETSIASEDIRVPAGWYVAPGDYVVVGFNEGKSWLEEVLPYSLFAKLVMDYNAGQLKIGAGSAEPDAGADGQVLMSGDRKSTRLNSSH